MKMILVGIGIFLATFFSGTTMALLVQADAAPSVIGSANAVCEPELEKPAVIEEVSQDNYGGWYALDKFTGMDEVTMIAISNSVGEDKASSAVFTTFENHGNPGVVESAWIKIDGNHVKFGTEKIKGIRYRFEGTFATASWSDREREKPLYGTLQKFVKGKKVAEVSGNFKYFEEKCAL